MKSITAYATTGQADGFVIGDNTLNRGAGPWIISMGNGQLDGLVEEIPQLDYSVPAFFDRGNQTTSISPRVDVGFSTEAERDEYLLNLQSSIPQVCHIEIVAGSTSLWIPFARVRPITWQLIGDLAAEITYNIRGQKMQSDTPIV